MIDGLSFGNFPSTAFLALEKQFKDFREVVLRIPTLDPKETWTKDLNRENVFVSTARTTFKTEKTPEVIVKYAATKEHPAQTEIFNRDSVIGEWTTIKEASLISPLEKSKLLDRIDTIIQEVKKARQRANNIEVEKTNIGNELLDYILS
jgi:hypothetical protein